MGVGVDGLTHRGGLESSDRPQDALTKVKEEVDDDPVGSALPALESTPPHQRDVVAHI